MQQSITHAEAPSAAMLEARFRAEGFVPGTPPTLTRVSRRIDETVVKRSRCPVCRQRGRQYKPFHKRDRQTGRTSYRIVAACPCGHGEEL